ncbi:MAG: carbohydrate binding domain-containing protein, partial [Ignavibacteriales bacterium]|nr:carbohydrate binding domain-containing protein [Ignavibacteriales bacterium]
MNNRVLWTAACGMLLLTGRLSGQGFSGGFNFYLPPQDTSSVRFLPQFPFRQIGASEFVSIDRDGHFSVDGNRVRFFGTNLVADGAFPAKEKAWFIAGHLRKMGFNLVRFHHLDNPWSTQAIFERGKDTRHLNPATLDRLENIIAELKRNGVYINMNLHVGRTFTAQDGVPEYDSLPEYGKIINYFDPQIIALHKEYARQLLTHVNPYTGKSLPNDPVMAMMEITNENSLYRAWRDGALTPRSIGGQLTLRHTKMLDELWHQFLINRYGTTESLRMAWSVGVIDQSRTDQIRNGGFEQNVAANWLLEKNGTAAAVATVDSTNAYHGKYSAKVIMQQTDGTDWHLQFKQIGLSIEKDSLYVISFAARSDSQRAINVTVQKETSPWTWFGGSAAALTTQWKSFSFIIRASEALAGDVRLSFSVGAQKGTCWFDDVSFGQPSTNGLLAGESLESKAIQRVSYGACSSFSDQRVRDISSFYIGLQSDYITQMRSFLKDSLGVKVPIVGTNWNVGPADLAAQATAD